MNNLKGKTAIVTGSSRGIGAAIAKELAKNGAKVVVNYTTSKDAAEEVVKQIIQGGSEAVSIQADVSLKENVSYLFDETIKHFGKVDILVNNAGVMHNTLIENATDDMFDKQININLKHY